jgi:hypothetical protein
MRRERGDAPAVQLEKRMSSLFLDRSARSSNQSGDEILMDHRQRLAHEEYERAERKRLELADLRSSLNGPDARIRAWEKAHGLRMPSKPMHPVLEVIAAATQLTLQEVTEEQRLRAARAADAKT